MRNPFRKRWAIERYRVVAGEVVDAKVMDRKFWTYSGAMVQECYLTTGRASMIPFPRRCQYRVVRLS